MLGVLQVGNNQLALNCGGTTLKVVSTGKLNLSASEKFYFTTEYKSPAKLSIKGESTVKFSLTQPAEKSLIPTTAQRINPVIKQSTIVIVSSKNSVNIMPVFSTDNAKSTAKLLNEVKANDIQ